MKVPQFLTSLILAGLLLLPGLSYAATGCSYPGSLDSFADKVTNDFLTVADVNKSNCAIEKLEAGPLRLNDGTAGAPSYAFRTSATAGMYLSAADEISWSTASTQFLKLSSAGLFETVGAGSIVGALKSIQVFTSSGTWTKPAGITQVKVTVVGGGGGGGRGTSTLEGSGGGGGGTSIELLDVTGTASETITVGAAGAGEGSGGGGAGAGGTSSFGSLLSATGGGAGVDTDNGNGGNGGVGSDGDVGLVGGVGFRAVIALYGGFGGNSSMGGGGRGAKSGQGAIAGGNYGGGGGGGGPGVDSGLAGAAGIVIVWEY